MSNIYIYINLFLMLYYLIYCYLFTRMTHMSWPRQTCLGLAATAGVETAMPGVERSIGIQMGKIWDIVFYISKLPLIYLWLVIFIPNFNAIYYFLFPHMKLFFVFNLSNIHSNLLFKTTYIYIYIYPCIHSDMFWWNSLR